MDMAQAYQKFHCVNVRGITDYPVRYPDGSIGYDRPERIPKHIKAKVAKVISEE